MEELRRKSERTMGILEEENKKLQTDVEKVCSDWFISKVKKKTAFISLIHLLSILIFWWKSTCISNYLFILFYLFYVINFFFWGGGEFI